MSIDKRILGNASILTVSHLIAQLSNFAFVIIFARAFGARLLGEYSFAMALGALLATIAGLGGRRLALRAASQKIERWKSLIGILVPAQIALSLLIFALVLLILYSVPTRSDVFWIIIWVAAFQLLLPFSLELSAAFSGQERMSFGGIVEIIRSLGVFLCIASAAWAGLSAELAVVSMPALALVSVIAVYGMARREYGKPKLRFAPAELAALVRQSLPFLGIALASVLFLRIGVLILRSISGAEAVGIFSAAERLVAAAVLLQSMLVSALYPRLVKLWISEKEQFVKTTAQAFRMIVLTTLPAATILALFSYEIVLVLYGTEYSGTADILRVLAFVLIARGVSTIASAVAIAQEQETNVLRSKLGGLVALVTIGGALAPYYGAMGLAWAVLVAELGALIILIVKAGHRALIASGSPSIFRTGAACLLASAAAVLFEPYGFALQGIAVLCVGATGLFLFRAVSWEELQRLARLIRAHPTG